MSEKAVETTPQPEQETVKDVAEEKPAVPAPPPPAAEEKAEAVAVDEKPAEKTGDESGNRDAVLARVETEKRLSLIKAWEENEKTKTENKATKKLSSITSWENARKADLEAKLKAIEEDLEKKKAEAAEKFKNKIANIHKQAEEKKAIIEAKRGEDLLKAEESSAKFRAHGIVPTKIFGCFGV